MANIIPLKINNKRIVAFIQQTFIEFLVWLGSVLVFRTSNNGMVKNAACMGGYFLVG